MTDEMNKDCWIKIKMLNETSVMLPTDIFEGLYENLLNDNRVNVCHCSIYMALILLSHKNELANAFPISRKGIMELSHFYGILTYHKCIRQLEAYGYIRYNPSYSYCNRSTIYLDNVIE